MELLLVTGLSGAGKSEVVKVLEDLGWLVIDNLPPALLETFVDLAGARKGATTRLAVVADVRGGEDIAEQLDTALAQMERREIGFRVVFLEAADDVIIRRYEDKRRRHPLGEVPSEAIAKERELLDRVKGRADVIIDTSDVNVHQLRAKIVDLFGEAAGPGTLQVSVVSFGYKHGLPLDADLVLDCRFLPNPHWVDELRPLPGTDPKVRGYVRAQPATERFLAMTGDLVRFLLPQFVDEGKAYLTLAIGCTGGHHRSVVIAEALGDIIQAEGFPVVVRHRDLER